MLLKGCLILKLSIESDTFHLHVIALLQVYLCWLYRWLIKCCQFDHLVTAMKWMYQLHHTHYTWCFVWVISISGGSTCCTNVHYIFCFISLLLFIYLLIHSFTELFLTNGHFRKEGQHLKQKQQQNDGMHFSAKRIRCKYFNRSLKTWIILMNDDDNYHCIHSFIHHLLIYFLYFEKCLLYQSLIGKYYIFHDRLWAPLHTNILISPLILARQTSFLCHLGQK